MFKSVYSNYADHTNNILLYKTEAGKIRVGSKWKRERE
jgi:hypothetical protein